MIVAVAALMSRELTLDLDEVASQGVRILTAFEVLGPFRRVRSYDKVQNCSPEYVIVLEAKNGRTYSCYASKEEGGRCRLVQRDEPYRGGLIPPRPSNGREVRLQRRKAETGIRRLKTGYRTISGEVRPYGLWDIIWIPVAVDNHPFDCQLGVGYSVTLDAVSGDFRSFGGRPNPPEVDRSPIKLRERDAVRAAERRFFRAAPADKTQLWVEYRFDIEHSPFNAIMPEPSRHLAWVVPAGSTKARLAWIVPGWRQEQGAFAGSHRGEPFQAIIDAETGELIVSRT